MREMPSLGMAGPRQRRHAPVRNRTIQLSLRASLNTPAHYHRHGTAHADTMAVAQR